MHETEKSTALTNKICSYYDFIALANPNCKATAPTSRGGGILIVNSAAKVPKDIFVHEGEIK